MAALASQPASGSECASRLDAAPHHGEGSARFAANRAEHYTRGAGRSSQPSKSFGLTQSAHRGLSADASHRVRAIANLILVMASGPRVDVTIVRPNSPPPGTTARMHEEVSG